MIFEVSGVLLVFGCVLGGFLHYRHDAIAAAHARREALAGWVYFLSPVNGAEAEPPAPIKIGLTHRDPTRERLPEIETMSPTRLELIAVIPTYTPELLEKAIHQELKAFKHHGEWYDRDAVEAYLSNLRGE